MRIYKLKKIEKIFDKQALSALYAWLKPVRWAIVAVSAIFRFGIFAVPGPDVGW